MVEVDWSLESGEEAFNAVLKELSTKGGLDYLPRERTSQGRIFEHACDAKLLSHLITTNPQKSQSSEASQRILFCIRLESENASEEEVNEQETEDYGEESYEEQSVSTTLSKSSAKNKQYLFAMKQAYMDMTIRANGKADLYFHAYIWYTYLLALFMKVNPNLCEKEFEAEIVSSKVELARLKGLSESLKKVAANITKFPFNKEIYERFVNDFGGKKQVKKLKLLEEL